MHSPHFPALASRGFLQKMGVGGLKGTRPDRTREPPSKVWSVGKTLNSWVDELHAFGAENVTAVEWKPGSPVAKKKKGGDTDRVSGAACCTVVCVVARGRC